MGISFGNIISGIFGGIIGFFSGGPAGAAWGFAIGFGGSLAMDALAPDMPSPGQPQTADLAFPSAEEGINIPDILGTTKLSGNIFAYFNPRTVEVWEEGDSGGCGGGGGGEDYLTGYKYFLSWAMGICIGPTDYLYAIYAGDDLIYSAELARPVSGGVQVITLGDMDTICGNPLPDDQVEQLLTGTVYFYFGTDDQAINSKMAAKIPDVPAFRGLCYAYFDDCYIGDYNRLPAIKFIVGKRPVLTFNANESINVYDDDEPAHAYDYNPAHAIWYIMTNDLHSGLPEDFLDASNFSDVADVLYEEQRGVSILFDRQQTAQAYIETILTHIGGIMNPSLDGDLSGE